jgi:RimJ/RimL family protein N-acetyltransferase
MLQRWVSGDAELLGEAVATSVEHLRPWMPWVAQEPLSVEARRELIQEWEREWAAGGDLIMGIFVDGAVAGGCGLHHRIGPGGLEIGYWTHVSFLRMGIASTAARLLTNAAFELPEISRVEIHHDQANEASAGVPRTLGFRHVREVTDTPQAPGEVGVSWEWQVTREEWLQRR